MACLVRILYLIETSRDLLVDSLKTKRWILVRKPAKLKTHLVSEKDSALFFYHRVPGDFHPEVAYSRQPNPIDGD